MSSKDIAIIDYGLGNLFSVKQACDYVGMDATITGDHEEIRAANGIILPGVGAFGRAMDSLSELQLDDVIQDVVESGKPLVGICLGAQLIMSESEEFGTHTGLDLIPGKVRRLDTSIDVGDNKVPHVGWDTVKQETYTDMSIDEVDVLDGIQKDEYMYFVHSYCIETDDQYISAETEYGNDRFCSAVIKDNVAGFQFHPERSGPAGLQIYKNIRQLIKHGDTDA